MTLTTGGSAPATRAVTRIWWSNDESDYSDCSSNNGTFNDSCFPEGKSNSDSVKVEFGSDVTSIGEDAFLECTNLTSVTIPNSVTSIGGCAFEYCPSLTSVTFEGKDRATVQRMSNYPFGLDFANPNGVTIHCTEDGDIQVECSI